MGTHSSRDCRDGDPLARNLEALKKEQELQELIQSDDMQELRIPVATRCRAALRACRCWPALICD